MKKRVKDIQGTRRSGDTVYSVNTDSVGDLEDKPAHRPLYRSKWEAAFAAKLELEKHAGLIKQWWYEPFSMWLPGKVRYKPDFMVEYGPTCLTTLRSSINSLEMIEVKGWSRNRRDGMTRLKIAAALFPCFVWRLVWMKKGGGFDGQYI